MDGKRKPPPDQAGDLVAVCHFQTFCGLLVDARQRIEDTTAAALRPAGAVHAQRITGLLNQMFEEIQAWKATVKP